MAVTAARPTGSGLSTPRTSPRFRADIQGLRGVAVLLVVAFHAGLPLPGGFVGVDVFFVVSGFVITGLLLGDLEEKGRLDFAGFYGRRVRRLLPALSLMLTVVTLASIGLGALGSVRLISGTGAAAALVVANLYLYRSTGGGYFDETSELNPLLHTWSLSVEEQFYVAFPALLAFGWWLGGRSTRYGKRAVVPIPIVVACVISLGMSFAMTGGGGPRGIADPAALAFYSAPTRAWEFGVGTIAALLTAGRARLGATARLVIALTGWLLVGWSALTYGPQTPFPGAAALAPVVGTVLLIIAGSPDGDAVRTSRLLEAGFLVWLGNLSYSWYLWHWPLVVFGRTLWPTVVWIPAVIAVASLGPAWLSYVFVEAPIRAWRPRSRAHTVLLASACLCLPLAGAAALEAASRAVSNGPNAAAYLSATRFHLDVTRGCDSDAPLGSRSTPCVWPASNARGRIVLIGDSNAGHLVEPVVEAARSLGHPLEVATSSSCPFVDVLARRHGGEQLACRVFFEGSQRALVAQPPALVIVAAASDAYVQDDQWALLEPGSTEWRTSPDGKGRLWAAQLESTLRSLRRTGTEVLLVHPIPRLGSWRARSCALGLVALWPPGCGVARSLEAATREQRTAREAEERSALATGTHTLDLTGDVCPGARCEAFRDGRWWYRDGWHLGVDGALALTPRFRTAMADALARD